LRAVHSMGSGADNHRRVIAVVLKARWRRKSTLWPSQYRLLSNNLRVENNVRYDVRLDCFGRYGLDEPDKPEWRAGKHFP
jgi:hypothetical protein